MEQHAAPVVQVPSGTDRPAWLPLRLCLGMPLQPPELCERVCDNAWQAGFLSAASLKQQQV